jgi:hypothetical protein
VKKEEDVQIVGKLFARIVGVERESAPTVEKYFKLVRGQGSSIDKK